MECKFVLGKTWENFEDEVDANKRAAKERKRQRMDFDLMYFFDVFLPVIIASLVIGGLITWVIFKLFS